MRGKERLKEITRPALKVSFGTSDQKYLDLKKTIDKKE
jgi:hypothetical protein